MSNLEPTMEATITEPMRRLAQRITALETENAKLRARQERVFAGELIPGVLAERIGILERDRALLLAYVRALEEWLQSVDVVSTGSGRYTTEQEQRFLDQAVQMVVGERARQILTLRQRHGVSGLLIAASSPAADDDGE